MYLQAASPACTELEIIVLDWLGKCYVIYVYVALCLETFQKPPR